MLFDSHRHEPLAPAAWDAARAAAAIEWIVRDTEARFSEASHWPLHAEDRQSENDARAFETSLYDGTCGVLWALGYLHDVGAVQLKAPGLGDLPDLLARNRSLLGDAAQGSHGAPGFVICLAELEGADIDGLLLAAGETTGAAGPLRKGSNLSHGTAGNGYAFLKLYRRTNDVLWLRRARAYAMHAVGPAEAEAKLRGQLRSSLWTGDLGLAVYLWDCMHGEARFPTLDVFCAPGRRA